MEKKAEAKEEVPVEEPVVQEISAPPEYLTIKEVAVMLRFSVDTLRRHFISGKLTGIEWVDFLGNKKLRATRESVEAFKINQLANTRKAYTRSLPVARGTAKNGRGTQAARKD